MHNVDSHTVDKDCGKFLKWQQKSEVVAAVRYQPLQSATEVRRNLHRTSPQKKIESTMSRSVERLVRTARRTITAERLGIADGEDPDSPLRDSYGAVLAVTEAQSFQKARQAHKLF